MIRGNKGEWSEIYALIKLLSEGKLFQSDIHLEPDDNNYYEVVKAYKDEDNSTLEFDRKEKIQLYSIKKETKTFIKEFTIEHLKDISQKTYLGIVKGIGSSFEIPTISNFIEEAKITKLKAKGSSKSDIKLRIYDQRLAKESDLGFSIKSLLGKDATLFNTGAGNNFIFNIKTDKEISLQEFNKSTYNPLGKTPKLTYRLKKLIDEFDAKITFKDIQSSQLWLNLKMVDGDLPLIISYCLLYRWLDGTSEMANLVNLLEERDPLNFYNAKQSEQKLYENKIKRFLAECAMGMTSEKPWSGIYDTTGGAIICKKDGSIVCFHIYDFNIFRDYLLHNTRLEQASTGEDENNPGNPNTKKGSKNYYWGWLYKDNEDLFIKINLQVRFI